MIMVMIGAANPIITLICVLADTLDMGDMEIGKEELEFNAATQNSFKA